MTFEGYQEYVELAKEYRKDGENEEAGRYYTLCAYEILGRSELTRRHDIMGGIQNMMEAAICYRLAGRSTLMRNRCRQGIAIVEDADERVYTEEPLHGAAQELIGDFKLVGRADEYQEAYNRAKEVYEPHEADSIQWQTEDEFELGWGPFVTVARAVGHEFEEYGLIRTFSLRARITYKQDHFPKLLEELDERGVWNWEDEPELW